MKKIFKGVLLALTSALFFSCASNSGMSSKEPAYTIEDGKYLDSLWNLYYETGDESYVDQVIAYADTEDLLMKKINQHYKELSQDNRYMSILEHWFSAEDDGKKITCPVDVESLISIIIQDEAVKNDIRYIYSPFDQDLFIRGIMKSTAVWSLAFQENKDARIVVQKKIPFMNEKLANNMYALFGMEDIVYYQKDSGIVMNQAGKAFLISSILVKDLDSFIDEWNTPVDHTPYIPSTSEVSKSKDKEVSFVVLYSFNEHEDYPVYIDIDSCDSKGDVQHFKNMLLIESKPASNLYSLGPIMKIIFEDTDPLGEYTIRLTVHTENTVLSVSDLTYKLKK